VVLPLWGWLRRQFDDRVALVACLLYIVQPKMIEWSPEIMRDQTFWLLFTLAIYWLWRAVTEVDYGYFLATGITIAMASLARVEGLFLLIPLVLWTFWRYLALQTGRRKLLVGAVLCVLAFPLLVVLINLGWVCSRSGWASIYLSPLARVRPWLEFVLGRDAGDAGDGPPLRFGRMIWVFIPTMTRGLAPIFALLMFGGIWRWRNVWRRRDHQVLFCTAVVIMCGIWVQLWFDRTICPRYALPIVLMASPWAALGMLDLMARLVRIAQRIHWGSRAQQAVVVAIAVIVVAINFTDAMTSNTKYFETRRIAEELGYWVQDEFSAPPVLVGPMDITPIVSYYSHSSPYQTFRWESTDDTILRIVAESKASVVLLPPGKLLKPQRCAALVDRMKSLGLEPVVPAALSATSVDLYVLVRNHKNPHVTSVKPCTTTDR
jgi:4-amino-4-deoxy-L-arabinose transferase-like glycosyltransferase